MSARSSFKVGDIVAVDLGDPKPGAVLDPVRTATGVVTRLGSILIGVKVGDTVWNVAPAKLSKVGA